MSTQDRRAVLSVVVGASDVEVLTLDETAIRAKTLPRPEADAACDYRVPTTAAMVDVDRDGREDAVVHDLCGAYVIWDVMGEEPRAEATAEWLPSDGAYEYLVAANRGGELELATGSATGVHFLRASDPGSAWSLLGQWRVPIPPRAKPRRGVAAGAGYGEWLVVGDERIYGLDASSATNVWIEFSQAAPTPPNLIPFSSFDYLTWIGSGACGASFVAIGCFTPSSQSSTPRIALQVELPNGEERGIRSRELPGGVNIAALGSVPGADGAALVATLGHTTEGQGEFVVYSVAACEQAVLRGRVDTTVSTRRPPAPGLGDYASEAPGSVSLDALIDGDNVVFISYDGYAVRTYRVTAESENWTVEQGVVDVHEDRSDLAFP